MMLRYAIQEDLEQLMRIERACFKTDLITETEMKRFLRLNGSNCHITVSADKSFPRELHGYILVLMNKRSRWTNIHSFGVKPTSRGTGISPALIQEACLVSKNLGFGGIKTHVRVDNPHAILRYKKSGFKISGVESDYYEDGCDAVIYTKTWDMN